MSYVRQFNFFKQTLKKTRDFPHFKILPYPQRGSN